MFYVGKTSGQSLDLIKKSYLNNELAIAQEQIDDYVKTNSTDAEGWFLKAKIYQSISKSNRYKDLVADANNDALNALIKVANIKATLLKQDSTAYYIYQSYFNNGVAFFNAGVEKKQKNDFEQAFSYFTKSASVSQLFVLQSHEFSIDTLNLFYLAKSAIYAEKDEEAIRFSQNIVENKLNEPKFEMIYQWLLYKLRIQNNKQALDKYSTLAVQAYPKSNYYLLNYIDWYKSLGDVQSLIKTYEKLFELEGSGSKYKLSYLNDLFNYTFKDTVQTKLSFKNDKIIVDLKQTLAKELTLYNQKNKNSTQGKLLAAKYYTNQAADFQQKINKNVDKNQAKQFKLQLVESLKQANFYLLQIISKQSSADKNTKAEAYHMLISNCTFLKQANLVKQYKLALIGLG